MSEQKMPTKAEFDAITKFAHELQNAKAVEAKAKQDRMTIEAKLACLIPGKEEGQRTINLPDKGKVVVERGLIYTADVGKIESMRIFAEIGVAAPIESKTTKKLHVEAYKWYQANQPVAFKAIAKHVDVKPKKTAVTVKLAVKPKAKK